MAIRPINGGGSGAGRQTILLTGSPFATKAALLTASQNNPSQLFNNTEQVSVAVVAGDPVADNNGTFEWSGADGVYAGDAWVDFNGLTAEQIKMLYESNPNTNAFTNDDKSSVDSVIALPAGVVPVAFNGGFAASPITQANALGIQVDGTIQTTKDTLYVGQALSISEDGLDIRADNIIENISALPTRTILNQDGTTGANLAIVRNNRQTVAIQPNDSQVNTGRLVAWVPVTATRIVKQLIVRFAAAGTGIRITLRDSTDQSTTDGPILYQSHTNYDWENGAGFTVPATGDFTIDIANSAKFILGRFVYVVVEQNTQGTGSLQLKGVITTIAGITQFYPYIMQTFVLESNVELALKNAVVNDITAGRKINIDKTDPTNPVISWNQRQATVLTADFTINTLNGDDQDESTVVFNQTSGSLTCTINAADVLNGWGDWIGHYNLSAAAGTSFVISINGGTINGQSTFTGQANTFVRVVKTSDTTFIITSTIPVSPVATKWTDLTNLVQLADVDNIEAPLNSGIYRYLDGVKEYSLLVVRDDLGQGIQQIRFDDDQNVISYRSVGTNTTWLPWKSNVETVVAGYGAQVERANNQVEVSVPTAQTLKQGDLLPDAAAIANLPIDTVFVLHDSTTAANGIYQLIQNTAVPPVKSWILRVGSIDNNVSAGAWLTGNVPPANVLGEDGNYYYQSANTEVTPNTGIIIYVKSVGSWIPQTNFFTAIQGIRDLQLLAQHADVTINPQTLPLSQLAVLTVIKNNPQYNSRMVYYVQTGQFNVDMDNASQTDLDTLHALFDDTQNIEWVFFDEVNNVRNSYLTGSPSVFTNSSTGVTNIAWGASDTALLEAYLSACRGNMQSGSTFTNNDTNYDWVRDIVAPTATTQGFVLINTGAGWLGVPLFNVVRQYMSGRHGVFLEIDNISQDLNFTLELESGNELPFIDGTYISGNIFSLLVDDGSNKAGLYLLQSNAWIMVASKSTSTATETTAIDATGWISGLNVSYGTNVSVAPQTVSVTASSATPTTLTLPANITGFTNLANVCLFDSAGRTISGVYVTAESSGTTALISDLKLDRFNPFTAAGTYQMTAVQGVGTVAFTEVEGGSTSLVPGDYNLFNFGPEFTLTPIVDLAGGIYVGLNNSFANNYVRNGYYNYSSQLTIGTNTVQDVVLGVNSQASIKLTDADVDTTVITTGLPVEADESKQNGMAGPISGTYYVGLNGQGFTSTNGLTWSTASWTYGTQDVLFGCNGNVYTASFSNTNFIRLNGRVGTTAQIDLPVDFNNNFVGNGVGGNGINLSGTNQYFAVSSNQVVGGTGHKVELHQYDGTTVTNVFSLQVSFAQSPEAMVCNATTVYGINNAGDLYRFTVSNATLLAAGFVSNASSGDQAISFIHLDNTTGCVVGNGGNGSVSIYNINTSGVIRFSAPTASPSTIGVWPLTATSMAALAQNSVDTPTITSFLTFGYGAVTQTITPFKPVDRLVDSTGVAINAGRVLTVGSGGLGLSSITAPALSKFGLTSATNTDTKTRVRFNSNNLNHNSTYVYNGSGSNAGIFTFLVGGVYIVNLNFNAAAATAVYATLSNQPGVKLLQSAGMAKGNVTDVIVAAQGETMSIVDDNDTTWNGGAFDGSYVTFVKLV